MNNGPRLKRLICGWEAPVGDKEPSVIASQAAIDHYVVFGHAIERTDMNGECVREHLI